MAFTPKLYATDIVLSEFDSPTELLILAEATDFVDWALESEGLYAAISNGEPKVFGGKKFTNSDITVKYQVKTLPIAFPTVATSIWEYYNIPFFKKQYHYLSFEDYTLFSDATSSAVCPRVAVQITGVEHVNEKGAKVFTLDVTLGTQI